MKRSFHLVSTKHRFLLSPSTPPMRMPLVSTISSSYSSQCMITAHRSHPMSANINHSPKCSSSTLFHTNNNHRILWSIRMQKYHSCFAVQQQQVQVQQQPPPPPPPPPISPVTTTTTTTVSQQKAQQQQQEVRTQKPSVQVVPPQAQQQQQTQAQQQAQQQEKGKQQQTPTGKDIFDVQQDELLEKMMKRSTTAARLLKPPTFQDRINALKTYSITFLKRMPNLSWKVATFLGHATLDFIRDPSIVKQWYVAGKKKAIHELRHYYSGFKLLVADIRSAWRLILKILKGHAMTRRERNLLVRTASDIFRLVPFAFFVIVPFAELLLPVAIKLFPNMLPSQFEDKLKKEEQLRKEFKAKLELGKFLQDTVELMAYELKKSDQAETVATAEELQKFINSIRRGEAVRNEDIIRFAKLFSDEITLDNVSRAQLMAMCKMVGISPYGSDFYLRFRLRNKIRQLKADDRLIYWEGVKSLSREELMYACQARGMKVVLSQEKMQQQLKDWIDLSLNKNVPASLLLLSRAFTYTDDSNVQSSDAIKMALGSLSDDVLGEVALQSTASTDGDIYEKKLESLKRQDKLIQQEEEIRKQKEQEANALSSQEQASSKALPSTATSEEEEEERNAVEKVLKHKKIQALNELLATLASESSLRNEREELDTLINDHIELIGETSTPSSEKWNKVQSKILSKIGELIGKLEEDIEHVDSSIGDSLNIIDKDKDGVISTQEVRECFKMLKDKPSDDEIEEIINKLDKDKDGKIAMREILLELRSAIKDA